MGPLPVGTRDRWTIGESIDRRENRVTLVVGSYLRVAVGDPVALRRFLSDSAQAAIRRSCRSTGTASLKVRSLLTPARHNLLVGHTIDCRIGSRCEPLRVTNV